MNTYAYVGGNPINISDFFGLFCDPGTYCPPVDNLPQRPLGENHMDGDYVCGPGEMGGCIPKPEYDKPPKEENLYCDVISPAIGVASDIGTIATGGTGIGAGISTGVGVANSAATCLFCEDPFGASTVTTGLGTILPAGKPSQIGAAADAIATGVDLLGK